MSISEKIQQNIVHLYQKEFLSMAQIAKKLNLSQSAVLYYLQKNNIRRRSRNEAVTHWHITHNDKKPARPKKILSSQDLELKIAGTMLYWAEGTKGHGAVKFTNSDPAMIKFFLEFLREIFGIWEERLKLLVHIYPDHKEEEVIKFWSQVTNVPRKNFYSSFIHEGKTGTYKKKSMHGTLTVSYADKKILSTINSWIDEYRNTL